MAPVKYSAGEEGPGGARVPPPAQFNQVGKILGGAGCGKWISFLLLVWLQLVIVLVQHCVVCVATIYQLFRAKSPNIWSSTERRGERGSCGAHYSRVSSVYIPFQYIVQFYRNKRRELLSITVNQPPQQILFSGRICSN